MPKSRVDEILKKQGICPSRSAAQNLIKNNQVFLADGTQVRKPSQMFDDDCAFTISEQQYVSRGALKLAAALEAFKPDINGKTALDLGASTGGFTQLLLQNGAAKVYAVDVGTDQLHPTLKADTRVVSLEKTNAKDLTPQLITEKIQVLTGDLSFISLTKVLPVCPPLLDNSFCAILLIKPQFEAGREQIGSGGVVRSEQVRQQCIKNVVEFAQSQLGWIHHRTIPSPILGQNGNQEYLAYFTN